MLEATNTDKESSLSGLAEMGVEETIVVVVGQKRIPPNPEGLRF